LSDQAERDIQAEQLVFNVDGQSTYLIAIAAPPRII
jgi:hypothetical protein